MATIGVDSSGKVDQLPMYMVAVRGDESRILLVNRKIPTRFKQHRDWKFIVTAAYIFKVVHPLFRKHQDSVIIDWDFDERGMKKLILYLTWIMKNYFFISEVDIREGNDSEVPVLKADTIARSARKRQTRTNFFNPTITREYELVRDNL